MSKFIVFEGIDGSGKSTLIKGLVEHLKEKNIGYIETREPGGTILGGEIRRLLLDKEGEAPVPRAELLMYLADRAQDVEINIRPALKQGKWVLCDRYTASTLAFQSAGRDIDENQVNPLNDYATDGLKPDLEVLLHVSLEESESRMQNRQKKLGQNKDRFESEGFDFHRKVQEKYLELAKKDPNQWLLLDGHKAPKEILEDLITHLEKSQWL